MNVRTKAAILREELSKEKVIISPLVYDSISAKIAQNVGFKI